MASKIGDLVHQTTNNTGSGTLVLDPVNGKRTFNLEFSNGAVLDDFYYFISHRTQPEWEVGTGHMSDAVTLVRDTVLSSSNSNSLVAFSPGLKDVVNDLPASIQNDLEGNFIRLDGTSTTTASIPFEQGLSISGTTKAYFGGSGTADARGQIYGDSTTYWVQGLDQTGSSSGSTIRLYGGDALQDGNNGSGGSVFIAGGDYDHIGDTLVGGGVYIGTSTIGPPAGTALAGQRGYLGVTDTLTVGGVAQFQGFIAVGGIPGTNITNTIHLQGNANRTIGVERATGVATSGAKLGVNAGGAKQFGSNLSGGNLTLSSGTCTGSGSSSVIIQVAGGGVGGTTDVAASDILTIARTSITVTDFLAATTFNFGTTFGTKFGGSTSQKLAFYNSTPIVQPIATTDLGTVLSNLGLRASGTAYPITTSGSVSFTGTIGLGGQVTVSDGINFAINTTTGTKFGTGTTQKIGFYNATPIIQPANTVAIDTTLVNLGLRASGGSANFDLDVKVAVAGKGLYVKEGSNCTMGVATLSAGTVTVNTTKVTATSRIFLTINGGTLTNIGSTYISARSAGTSFTITSTNILDASDVAWMIVEPA